MIRVYCMGKLCRAGEQLADVASMVGVLASDWPVVIKRDDAELFSGTAKEALQFIKTERETNEQNQANHVRRGNVVQ